MNPIEGPCLSPNNASYFVISANNNREFQLPSLCRKIIREWGLFLMKLLARTAYERLMPSDRLRFSKTVIMATMTMNL